MKILYIVHRYAPHPGGSENYTRDLAEETLSRGHEVWVLADQHMGDYNGVKLSSDPDILTKSWDMIIVHGTQRWQQIMMRKFKQIRSPKIFMPVEMPIDHPDKLKVGFKFSTYVAYSTEEDQKFVKLYGIKPKSVYVRHGVNEGKSIGKPGFKNKYGITTSKMILSSGGFWKHKNMQNLIDNFEKAKLDDTTLVVTGYWNPDGEKDALKYNPDKVKVFALEDREDVLSAMSEADLYVLNSIREGFGIVLIEAMLNKLPWASRDTPGAVTMSDFGYVYDNDEDLVNYLKSFKPAKDNAGFQEAMSNRLIKNAVDDIFNVINSHKQKDPETRRPGL